MPLTTSSTLAGFPDAQNTGVRDGVTLRQVGDMTITTPGAVISGLEIHGTLRIEADNVTVRDCKIVNEGGWNGILIPDGNTGAVVEYCDIIGPINGISGTGTFRFNDFSSNDNGINVYGPSLIQDNYIHDMSGGSDAHYDGIEINGGGGTTIRHNTIINEHGQTSAVMINNDFGAVPGIIIDNNYLAGGGYTIYSDARFSSTDPITGVEITNNYLGQGYWGYYAFMNNTPLVSGNHLLGTTWPTPVSDGSTPIPTPGSGSVSINDVTIGEGNSGTSVATFTVTRSGGTAAFDVNFATSNATATVADSDFVATSNTLHFGANESSKTISVTINGDTKVEANQTFNVVLSNATNGATISDSQGVGTITNDDVGVTAGSVSINDVTIGEGNSGTSVATFTVTRSGGTAAFDVNFATSNATATVADSDYVVTSNTLHFGANESSKTISVTINGDTKVEANQTFNVVLSNATNGATISDSQGVGTITNDDVGVTAGSVSINDVTIGEGNSGTSVATFTVTRSGGTAAFDVNFATSNATATVADSDYVATFNTLHFGANESSKTISVTINGDTKVEANQTFNVVLSNATNGAAISDSQGVGTITNDDSAVIANNIVTNGGFEAGNFTGWSIGPYQPEQTLISPNSHSGNFAAALGPAGGDGSLSQDLGTTPGQHYTLDFWLANMSTATDNFTVTWGGTKLMGLVNQPAQGYTEYKFDVVATSTTTHLEFDYRQDPTQWRLDDISVVGAGTSETGTAPTSSAVGLTSLSENSRDIVTIKGTADAFSLIQLYDGATSLGTVATAADSTWSFKTSAAVSNTVHTFTAQEIDGTGHVVASSGSAILGSTGNNTLTSTAGNDLFVGNGGKDTFVFAPNFGNDVIKDFSAGGRSHDSIQFSKSVFDSFASVLAHASQVGQDVVISADASDSVTLKNTGLSALRSWDFHFA